MFVFNNTHSFLFVLAIGLLTLFTNCKDHNNSIPGVEITITGSNNLDDSKHDTIAVFETPWGNPLDLNNAEHVQFEKPLMGYGTQYIHDEADDKDIYIFQAVKYSSSFTVDVTSFPVKTSEINPKISVQRKITTDLPQNEIINFYLFFIDGIGDKPTSPVKISYVPIDEKFEEIPGRVTVYLDPNKHTLPNNATLYKNWDDLSIDQYSEFYLNFNVKLLNSPSEYQPVILTRNIDDVGWFITTTSYGEFSFSLFDVPMNDKFEMLMYTIDRNQLTQ